MEMLVEPMYHAVFYDVSLPKNFENSMTKRLDVKQYANLIDGIIEKQVELKRKQDPPQNYKVLEVRVFHICNSVDNTFFAVCDCEKIK